MRNTRHLVQSSLFTAVIFVCITFLHIPNGLGGIIHFGDGLIFLAGALLPLPYAMVAASLGAGLMNWHVGSPFLPFTLAIKPLLTMFFTSRQPNILCKQNYGAPFLAATLNTGLYAIANGILFGGRPAAIASIPALLIQGGASIAFYFILAYFLDKAQFKRRILQ